MCEESKRYWTFKRTAKDWKSFARTRKFEDLHNLTYDEARRRCEKLNAELTSAQKRAGTKFEFERY